MDEFTEIKGVKILLGSQDNLTGEINLIIEMMEQPTKTMEKDAFNQEVAIVWDMQKEIRALNDKIKSLCMKADLDITESGFIVNQKYRISLQTVTNNHIRVIKDLICGTTNPTKNEAVRFPEIASPKL